MIEKESFGFAINCDYCSNYMKYEEDHNFRGAVDMVKATGWKIRKEGIDWLLKCPVCQEKQ